jgi:hypothetical protein
LQQRLRSAQIGLGQHAERSAEGGHHVLSVWQREQIDQGAILPFHESDFQLAHEPADGEPEIVPHQDEALHAHAVALPQGPHQLGVVVAAVGVQELLELVQHQQQLAAGRQPLAAPQRGQDLDQAPGGVHLGTVPGQAAQKAHFRLVGRRLAADGQDVPAQPRQQARSHQRRLAAAGGAVQQAHREGAVRVGRLDALLPEADAVGQAVAVAGPGQQFQEEVGVARVESPQTLGNHAAEAPLRRWLPGG